MPLPDDLLTENVSDTDNANTIVRRAMSAAEKAEWYTKRGGKYELDLGVKCAEIAERLARTASYIAAVERSTKIDDSGQSDDSDGPDDPYGPSDHITPNGNPVDGTYSES
ncbi:MAG: hypothetical protein F4184_01970 [Gemmatimonadetes bacterium]|nr:hypothetical protein [Gemmatimonadota bacterium]